MLGHQLLKHLRTSHDVRVTLRSDRASYSQFGLFTPENSFERIDAHDHDAVRTTLMEFRPDAVVNCVGVIKQSPLAHDPVVSIEINALFPHVLAELCRRQGARLVHLSTDCVFSGKRGGYREIDAPDATDLYGRSKLLGEIDGSGCLTLRTSIVGLELSRNTGLLEWFLSQKGKRVNGYRKAIFSGFTTLEMSRVIEHLLVSFPDAQGLYHVSSEPVSKFDLLQLFNRHMRLDMDIVPDDKFHCDRSLDSTRFREAFAYEPPTWEAMAEELGHEYRQRAR
jgi:dTDP-4-dehydrorhamnose reductase